MPNVTVTELVCRFKGYALCNVTQKVGEPLVHSVIPCEKGLFKYWSKFNFVHFCKLKMSMFTNA